MLKNKFIFLLFSAIILFVPQGSLAQGRDLVSAYDGKGKRDPLIPLVTADGRIIEPETLEPGTKEVKLRLEGIIFDPAGLSAAVINGGIVKSGEMIAGEFQVLEIQQKKVILRKDNQKVELKLNSNRVLGMDKDD